MSATWISLQSVIQLGVAINAAIFSVAALRGPQVFTDLIDVGGSVRRDPADPEFWLLLVSVAEKLECWLRFRWKEPDASDLTVVVQEKNEQVD